MNKAMTAAVGTATWRHLQHNQHLVDQFRELNIDHIADMVQLVKHPTVEMMRQHQDLFDRTQSLATALQPFGRLHHAIAQATTIKDYLANTPLMMDLGISKIAAQLEQTVNAAAAMEKLALRTGLNLDIPKLPSIIAAEHVGMLFEKLNSTCTATDIISRLALKELTSFERYAAATLEPLTNAITARARELQNLRLHLATQDITKFTNLASQLGRLPSANQPLSQSALQRILRPQLNIYDAFEYDTETLPVSTERPGSLREAAADLPAVQIPILLIELVEKTVQYDQVTQEPFYNCSPEATVIVTRLTRVLATDAIQFDAWIIAIHKYFIENRGQDYKQRIGKQPVIDDISVLRQQACHDKTADPSPDRREAFKKKLQHVYRKHTGN